MMSNKVSLFSMMMVMVICYQTAFGQQRCICNTKLQGKVCGSRSSVFYPGEYSYRLRGNCNPLSLYQCNNINQNAQPISLCKTSCTLLDSIPGQDKCEEGCICNTRLEGKLYGTRTTNLYPGETGFRLRGDCNPKYLYSCTNINGNAVPKNECSEGCLQVNSAPGRDICPGRRC